MSDSSTSLQGRQMPVQPRCQHGGTKPQPAGIKAHWHTVLSHAVASAHILWHAGLLCGVHCTRNPPCALPAHMVQMVSAVLPAIHRLESAVSALLLKMILATRLRVWLAVLSFGCVWNVVHHPDFSCDHEVQHNRQRSPGKDLMSAAWRANAYHLVHDVADAMRECEDEM